MAKYKNIAFILTLFVQRYRLLNAAPPEGSAANLSPKTIKSMKEKWRSPRRSCGNAPIVSDLIDVHTRGSDSRCRAETMRC